MHARALAALGIVAVLAAAPACGGGTPWLASDTEGASQAVYAEELRDEVCQSDAGCTPAMNRSTSRAVICRLTSMLHHHGEGLDAGAGCQPQP
jgi:hypothetical protein